MLSTSIIGTSLPYHNYHGIIIALLLSLLVSSLITIPGINATGGKSSKSSSAKGRLNEEQTEFIEQIKEFVKNLALENKQFDQESDVMKEMLAKSVPDGEPSLKQCLLDPEHLKLDNDGTIGQIVIKTEAYFKEFNLNMDPKYKKGQRELVLLKELTALFKQFHLNDDHVKFLEEKIKIGSHGKGPSSGIHEASSSGFQEASSSGIHGASSSGIHEEDAKIELFKKLHEFRDKTNKKIVTFLKTLWFQIHSKFIKNLLEEIKADQKQLIRQELRGIFERSGIFKEISKIIREEVEKAGKGFEEIFAKNGSNEEKSPKALALAPSTSLTLREEHDNEATINSKRVLKLLLGDLQLLYEEQKYSEKFKTNLQSCKQLQQSITESQNVIKPASFISFRLNRVCELARKMFDGIQSGIENALEEKKNAQLRTSYTRFRTQLLLNSMIEQIFYTLLPEIGINLEHNNVMPHSMHHDEPFHGFALLQFVVEESVKPNLLKTMEPEEKKKDAIANFLIASKKKEINMFTSVKKCLANAKKRDKSPSDLYRMVMEREEICLLERMVDNRKSKHCVDDFGIRIALNAFKMLAVFRRLGTFYNEMGQKQLIEEYKQRNGKKIFNEFFQIRAGVVVNWCAADKLSECIFDEFPEKEDKSLESKRANEESISGSKHGSSHFHTGIGSLDASLAQGSVHQIGTEKLGKHLFLDTETVEETEGDVIVGTYHGLIVPKNDQMERGGEAKVQRKVSFKNEVIVNGQPRQSLSGHSDMAIVELKTKTTEKQSEGSQKKNTHGSLSKS